MKKIISILLVLMLALGATVLGACNLMGSLGPSGGESGPSQHEHEYLKYEFNNEMHWKVCSCEDTTDLEEHEDGDENGYCDVCNYKLPATHTHSYSPDYMTTKGGHYKICSCGDKIEEAEHEDKNLDYKCDVCNYQLEKPSTHTHSYGSTYVKTETEHYKVCSCGDKKDKGAHVDQNTDYACDVCGYELPIPSNPNPDPEPNPNPNPGGTVTPSAPTTPVIPGHPTTGDSSYLGQTAVAVYNSAVASLTNGENYTFKSTQNVGIDVDMSAMGMGYVQNFGTQILDFHYAYAGLEFYGKDKYFITADYTKIPGIPAGDATVETIRNDTYEITCDDNVVYMMMAGAQSIKAKDNGTFSDLQNATGIPLQIKNNPLFVPSESSLANGYFNVSNDGATLTIKISGKEAEDFIKDTMSNSNISALAVSDIVYIVNLDAQGNLIDVDYYFQIFALFNEMLPAYYNYSCTTTITEVGTTVVNAPADASNYLEADFIK
ncbi:MAG: hypothetical protein E7342_01115 [Clostridiales bacterium]|nr:hypothetical protein [Clostridiales bacterium]